MNPWPSEYPPAPRPAVVGWFKAYCGVLCAMYLFSTALSAVFFVVSPVDLDMSPTEALIVGGLLLTVSLPLLAACALPFFLRPRPWVWVYDIVIICLGMTSACCLPACIPLLIFWLRPEVKRYFGREP